MTPGTPTEPATFDQLAAVIRGRRTSMLVDKECEVPVTFVEQLCELASWAPNHKKTWPWRFALFTGNGRNRLGETMVADMVDCFVVLMQPGSGDELQGIKKGVLEHADLLVVNKADGENLPQARTAVRDLSAALRYLRAPTAHWQAQVLAVSSKESTGLEELWTAIEEHHAAVEAAGVLAEQRAAQRVRWMWALVEERLQAHFRSSDAVRACLAEVEAAVTSGGLPPGKGAELLLRAFREESGA